MLKKGRDFQFSGSPIKLFRPREKNLDLNLNARMSLGAGSFWIREKSSTPKTELSSALPSNMSKSLRTVFTQESVYNRPHTKFRQTLGIKSFSLIFKVSDKEKASRTFSISARLLWISQKCTIWWDRTWSIIRMLKHYRQFKTKKK